MFLPYAIQCAGFLAPFFYLVDFCDTLGPFACEFEGEKANRQTLKVYLTSTTTKQLLIKHDHIVGPSCIKPPWCFGRFNFLVD